MGKLLVLSLDGDFATGFDVSWEIGSDGQRPSASGIIRLALPPCPNLVPEYQQWQDTYRSLDGTRITPKPDTITNVRYTDLFSTCQQTADNLAAVVNEWFDGSPLSRTLNEDLLTNIEDEYRVIICTDNPQVRHIPWLLWTGWQKFPHLEISLGTPYTKRRDRIYQQQVRVLVILGNSEGINTDTDRQILEGYCQDSVYIEFLDRPTISQLRHQLSDARGWDIISFSGHSRTEGSNSGRIYLNQTDSLTMAQLRVELATAIKKGLQLAIFNSCDGLGIAAELEILHIPQVIVMRQPVPDRVAQEFLKYFLAEFTGGKSLYQSVSIARRKLQKLESEFPCASWLPTIVQNRLEVPPTWQSLGSIPKCPYRGLAAFGEEDKDYFYGREAFVQTLVRAIASQSIVPLIGASGCGKSSVIFAGLVPQLQNRDYNWQIVAPHSGDKPIEALGIAVSSLVTTDPITTEDRVLESKLIDDLQTNELALVDFISQHHLADSDRQLLLIVDRFEKLYTSEIDRTERIKFLKNILNALDRFPNVKLLFGIRADCYQHVLADRTFDKFTVSDTEQKLIEMMESELASAIFAPAEKLNVQFEEGLVKIITDSIVTKDRSKDASNLPLLQFVLTKLWDKQENGYLTHRAYEEIGGLEKALADRAETFYNRLTSDRQTRVHSIFIQLVQIVDNLPPMCRIANRADIGEDNWQLINDLVAERLVIVDRHQVTQVETIELIHESLIQHWHTFSNWVETDRDFRQWQEQLRFDIDRWEKSGRNRNALISGKLLDLAVDRSSKYSLNSLEQNFINLSLLRRQEDNRAKRRRWIILILMIGTIAASLFAVIRLFGESTEQQKKLDIVTVENLLNNNRQLEALKIAKVATENVNRYGTSSDRKLPVILYLEYIYDRIHEKKILTPSSQDPITSVTYIQDDSTIASISNNGLLNIYGADGKTIQSFSVGEKISRLIVSTDGKIIITVSDKTLQLWNRKLAGKWSKGELIKVDKEITSAALSLNGKVLAVALDRGGVQLYRDFSPTPSSLISNDDYIQDLKFTPDGKIIAANADGTVKVWSDAVNSPILKIANHQGEKLMKVAVSNDGKKIASGDKAGRIKIVDLKGRLLADNSDSESAINGKNEDAIKDLEFTADSQLLASSSGNKEIKIWKINDRKLDLFDTLKGDTDVHSLSFSPDGKNLVAGNADGSVRLWQINLNNSSPIIPDSATAFNYSPDGRLLAVGTPKGNITIIDRQQQKIISSIKTNHSKQITGISLSFDGQHLATVAGDSQEVKLWKLNGENITPITTLKGSHCNFNPKQPILAITTKDNKIVIYDADGKFKQSWSTKQSTITHLSFTSDGFKIITGDVKGDVKLWYLRGISSISFPSEQGPVQDVSYSSNGILAIASGLKDSKVTFWSDSGKFIRSLDKVGIDSLSFSQDGQVLLTGNGTGQLQLWKLNGEELKIPSTDNQNSGISKVRFSSDDLEIIAIDIDGKVIHHNLNSEHLLKQANNWLK